MSRVFLFFIMIGLLGLGAGTALSQKPAESPEWSFNATVIEACSCPMFCQCYFNNAKPAGHGTGGEHEGHGGSDHFCRFNLAFQVNKGHHGDTSLDNVKFWIGGDLGDELSTGNFDWAVLTFEKPTTPEQREAIGMVLGHLFPVTWDSFTMAEDGDISWEADKDKAEAKLNGGKTAEVVLKRFPGMSEDPVVIENLKWWGAARNDGFVLMPNEIEAWHAGDKAFEFGGGNGFMITIDINSKDVS